MKLITILVLSAFIVLNSCTTKQTIDCINEQAGVVLAGFDSTATDTIVVRRYQRNGSFDFIIRTDTLIEGNYANSFADGMTTLQMIFGDTLDLEIRLPATGDFYRISDIVYEPPHQKTIRIPFGAKVDIAPCFNQLLSYSLDGVNHTWPEGQQYLSISK